jgi:hypothetical protein
MIPTNIDQTIWKKFELMTENEEKGQNEFPLELKLTAYGEQKMREGSKRITLCLGPLKKESLFDSLALDANRQKAWRIMKTTTNHWM